MSINLIQPNKSNEAEIPFNLPKKYFLLPTGNLEDLALPVTRRPNLWFRLFQQWFFGFKYIQIDLAIKTLENKITKL